MTCASKRKNLYVVRKEKTQWHNVVGFGKRFAQLTVRTAKTQSMNAVLPTRFTGSRLRPFRISRTNV